jgi:HAD superfamily hydrolase (TIGR01509 family)
MQWQCVIFDCDGVLVNSETLYADILAEMSAELGLALTRSAALTLARGRALADCIREIEARISRPVPSDFEKTFRLRCSDIFQSQLRAIEGIDDVLNRIPVPYCIASNSPLGSTRSMLRITGLSKHFGNRIYSSHQVRRWKPDPGVFLYAAARMSVEPQACAVIEDSEAGVKAAVAARMGVFVYTPPPGVNELWTRGAGITFSRMSDLPDLLFSSPTARVQ